MPSETSAQKPSAATSKRSESTADNTPDALRQSRNHMKRCFAKYIEKGRRTMKLHHLMDEMDIVIVDKNERNQVLEGVLGYILCSTQVLIYFSFLFTVSFANVMIRLK
jgi:sucrose synthase